MARDTYGFSLGFGGVLPPLFSPPVEVMYRSLPSVPFSASLVEQTLVTRPQDRS